MDTETTSTIESKSDAELMKAVGRRESDAIQEIYKRYESALRSVIQSVLHDEGETDDTLNDVFLQLWDHSDRFDAAKGLHGFLVTMARPSSRPVTPAFSLSSSHGSFRNRSENHVCH